MIIIGLAVLCSCLFLSLIVSLRRNKELSRKYRDGVLLEARQAYTDQRQLNFGLEKKLAKAKAIADKIEIYETKLSKSLEREKRKEAALIKVVKAIRNKEPLFLNGEEVIYAGPGNLKQIEG